MLQTLRKPTYPISSGLREYLAGHGREMQLPIKYEDLRSFRESTPLTTKEGKDTLWETVLYYSFEMGKLHEGLKEIYAILKCGGDRSVMEHLYIDRIDFCSFGNSEPFRVRVVNSYNDNQDYYYVKKADASRVYGLELEHLLSPNRMHYLTCVNTLIEEHVAGVPGDIFIKEWLHRPDLKIVRLAKELVKFNERCLTRLLGDMRSCNFVMDVTPDIEEVQIRIRPMDFDQQSYQGRLHFYLPQFFKENTELVLYCLEHINTTTARQYQREEQSLILRRVDTIWARLRILLDAMVQDPLSNPEKITQLREELAAHYKDASFLLCTSMGQLVRNSLETLEERLRR